MTKDSETGKTPRSTETPNKTLNSSEETEKKYSPNRDLDKTWFDGKIEEDGKKETHGNEAEINSESTSAKEKAEELLQKADEAAQKAAESVKETAVKAAETAKETAQKAVETAKETARKAAEITQETVNEAARKAEEVTQDTEEKVIETVSGDKKSEDDTGKEKTENMKSENGEMKTDLATHESHEAKDSEKRDIIASEPEKEGDTDKVLDADEDDAD